MAILIAVQFEATNSSPVIQIHSLAAALFLAAILTIATAALVALGTLMRRRSTRQWQGEGQLLDPSYGGTLKRTLYRAARVKWLTYVTAALLIAGIGLLAASGIAKLATS